MNYIHFHSILPEERISQAILVWSCPTLSFWFNHQCKNLLASFALCSCNWVCSCRLCHPQRLSHQHSLPPACHFISIWSMTGSESSSAYLHTHNHLPIALIIKDAKFPCWCQKHLELSKHTPKIRSYTQVPNANFNVCHSSLDVLSLVFPFCGRKESNHYKCFKAYTVFWTWISK